ncbi:hypothetical protein BGX27_008807 [Mortierella sp. AM989]|nr:hypothetical protein BGX27_008807 [Mortierella sp. AM989]
MDMIITTTSNALSHGYTSNSTLAAMTSPITPTPTPVPTPHKTSMLPPTPASIFPSVRHVNTQHSSYPLSPEALANIFPEPESNEMGRQLLYKRYGRSYHRHHDSLIRDMNNVVAEALNPSFNTSVLLNKSQSMAPEDLLFTSNPRYSMCNIAAVDNNSADPPESLTQMQHTVFVDPPSISVPGHCVRKSDRTMPKSRAKSVNLNQHCNFSPSPVPGETACKPLKAISTNRADTTTSEQPSNIPSRLTKVKKHKRRLGDLFKKEFSDPSVSLGNKGLPPSPPPPPRPPRPMSLDLGLLAPVAPIIICHRRIHKHSGVRSRCKKTFNIKSRSMEIVPTTVTKETIKVKNNNSEVKNSDSEAKKPQKTFGFNTISQSLLQAQSKARRAFLDRFILSSPRKEPPSSTKVDSGTYRVDVDSIDALHTPRMPRIAEEVEGSGPFGPKPALGDNPRPPQRCALCRCRRPISCSVRGSSRVSDDNEIHGGSSKPRGTHGDFV